MRLLLPDPIDRAEVLRLLGMSGAQPDASTARLIEEACGALERAAQPRGTYVRLSLEQARPLLKGRDIAAHLAGCSACVCLACTLGTAADALLRAAGARDMARAVVMDAAASVMAEAAADALQQLCAGEAAREGMFLTGRFSPGYGDCPIEMQAPLLAVLDAQRKIGLAATPTHILTPRKSVTALCGMADHPVRGKLAGCANCALRDTCTKRRQGGHCDE